MRWVFCQALTHHLSKLTAPKIDTSIAAMSFENVRGRGTIELVGAENEVYYCIKYEMFAGKNRRGVDSHDFFRKSIENRK